MATATETAQVRGYPRLAWAPIIAGVLLALASHVVLGLIGAALGFSAEPTDSRALGVLAGFWGLITPLVATLLGAWLACRLAALEEVRATNLHGVMVWSIGIVAGALFLTEAALGGAMSAGTAASGNAGIMQRMMGPIGRPGAARTEAAQDAAAGAAAKAAGGAAMAGLAGLLGAFAGAAIARSRREGMGLGKGFGWRIAIQRTAHHAAEAHAAHGDSGRAEYPDRAYPPSPAESSEERTREVERSEGPGAPPPGTYQH